MADATAIEAAGLPQRRRDPPGLCKEDREALIHVSAQGTFNLLDAAMRTKRPQRVILASGDAVNGIYFNPQPVPDPRRHADGRLSRLLRPVEGHRGDDVPAVFPPGRRAHGRLRMSWIQAEDDILTHLTVAGDQFGVPVWSELMDDQQRAEFADGRDAAVALRHPDGTPMRRHVVAVEDCVQAFLLALETEGIEGETFMIAMNDPFDYVEAAALRRRATGHRRRSTWSTRSGRISASTRPRPATCSATGRSTTSSA